MEDSPIKVPKLSPEREACPYGDLYIYYLDGSVEDEAFFSDKNFLGNWNEGRTSFLFFSRPAQEAVTAFLKNRPGLNMIDQFCLDYALWQGKDLVPFQIGAIRVMPFWYCEKSVGTAGDTPHTLLLDPGVVFGSRTHPTTIGCLKALNLLFERVISHTILDLGTGTGILALAAVKLGAQRALAVDLNPLAARTAQKNIRINRMENKILAIQGDAKDFIDCPADLVIANIHYDAMKGLLCAKGLNQKRWVILSGLMRSEARDVTDVLASKRFDIVESQNHEGIWYTYLLTNRAKSIELTAR